MGAGEGTEKRSPSLQVGVIPVLGHEVIKLFSCLIHLSMKCILLINVKVTVIVGI